MCGGGLLSDIFLLGTYAPFPIGFISIVGVIFARQLWIKVLFVIIILLCINDFKRQMCSAKIDVLEHRKRYSYDRSLEPLSRVLFKKY